jgi:hypothetical protein
MSDRLYEVWLVTDAEERLVARFKRFDDAKSYCQTHAGEGRHDLKMPNGRWYGSRNTEPVANPDDYADSIP